MLTPSTIQALLQLRAAEAPDRVGYTYLPDRRAAEVDLTYAELERRARVIAAALQDMRGCGERVLLLYPPGVDYVTGFFGALLAGAVPVPAYAPYQQNHAARIAAMAHDCGATIALTHSSVLSEGRLRALGLLPGAATAEGAVPVAGLQPIATDLLPLELAQRWRDPGARPDDVAYLQYTSGSTAAPRGVVLTHQNVLHNAKCISSLFALTPQDRAVSWLPLFHDMGLVGMVLASLFGGVPVTLMSPTSFLKRPLSWLEVMSRKAAHISGAPDFAYNICIDRITPEALAALDLSNWRIAFSGAEAVRAQTLERFARAFAPAGFRPEALYPCYGLAEASLIVSGGQAGARPVVRSFKADALSEGRGEPAGGDEGSTRRLVGSGHPLESQTLAVVDPQTRRRRAANEIGEIWVSGPCIGQGYWRRDDDTRETFRARIAGTGEGPFLRTGDLGFLDGGELFIVGRLKDTIIIRGRNYYPDDIELTITSASPSIAARAVVAFSVEQGNREHLVVCREVPADTGPIEMDRVIQTSRDAVTGTHEVEVHAVLLVKTGGLPKTPSGKIQRGICRERYLKGQLRALAQWTAPAEVDKAVTGGSVVPHEHAPRSASALRERYQSWLVAWVARHARLDEQSVDLRESFAVYNMGSFDATRLAGELEDWLGRRLSPALVYDYPNIEALAGHLAGWDGRRDTPDSRSAHSGSNEIAIVGLACRVPGADNAGAFWELVRNGGDGIGTQPESRRSLLGNARYLRHLAAARFGGFLEDVEMFDADFFGISPLEAQQMDPQHRILLELAWEALEAAGQTGPRLRGSHTGVFVGISTNDYHELLLSSAEGVSAYLGSGNAASIAANRLSYLLDLHGPSLAVDTACSSSLVATHLACRSLASGECDLALAGGVNLMLVPELTMALSKAGMMSASGRCRTFDAAADGYVRGEGGGMVVLKRLSDARRDGDAVLAVVLGSAVNQDGRTAGLTAPNGPAQQAVIRAALHHAGIRPDQVQYVEAHGTGTPLGDPIELASIQAAYGENRPAESRCAIGSVKANVGHLEAAAGVVGLIKTVLALQRGEIPPNVHLRQINPNIQLDGTPFDISNAPALWPATDRRVAGVSSFGFGGTNCHLIVADPLEVQAPVTSADRPSHLFVLSAPEPGALREFAGRHAAFLETMPAESLADMCFSAATGRTHFEHRLAVPSARAESLREALATFAREGRASLQRSVRKGVRPRVAFLFTGQGSQYAGMGRELYETQPVFRRALERCADILRDELDQPLLSVLHHDDTEQLNETAFAQPALCALAYALSELWRSWGVTAGAVLGHSVGEFAAAIAAGVLSLEDGLRLVARRGALMQSLPNDGQMAALLGDEAQALSAIAAYGGVLAVAARNAPDDVVVAGPHAAVADLVADWKARGHVAQLLKAARAFHSPLMDPILDAFEGASGRVHAAPPQVEWVSSVSGGVIRETPDAQYWRRQAREPVQFAAGIRTLSAQGYRVFVEVGPNPVLTDLGRRNVGDQSMVWVPSLRRGRRDWDQLLESLGALYVEGMEIDWNGFDGAHARRHIVLPTYPFQRRRHWVTPTEAAVGAAAPVEPAAAHPLVQHVVSGATRQLRFESALSARRAPYLADHRVYGRTVLPASAIVEVIVAAAADFVGSAVWRLEDLLIATPFTVPEGSPRLLELTGESVGSDVWSVRLVSRDETSAGASAPLLHASAKVRRLHGTEGKVVVTALDEARSRATNELALDTFYAALNEKGLQYGRAFRPLEQAWYGAGQAVGRIRLRPEELGSSAAYHLHPVLLDGCFQLVAAALARTLAVKVSGAYIPLGVERFELRRRAGDCVWGCVSVQLPDGEPPEVLTAELTLFDDDGRLVAMGSGLTLRRVAALRASPQGRSPRLRLQSVADRPDWRYWECEIDQASLPDGVYRLRDGAVLHTAAFAEMARMIARDVLGTDACAVSALQLHHPLLVGNGSRHLLQTSIATHARGAATVRVHSQALVDRDPCAEWKLHATASVLCDGRAPLESG